jgi:hypothetical protein
MENCQYCRKPLALGRRKYCLDCAPEAKRDRNKQWHIDNKEHRSEKDKVNHKSPSYRWNLLKSNGRKRGLEVSIMREQFEDISKRPCCYCDGSLDKDSGWGSHIDRINNDIGYTYENSVSCCDFCNRIKQDLLSYEENKAVIKLIVKMRSENAERNTTTPNSSTSDRALPDLT